MNHPIRVMTVVSALLLSLPVAAAQRATDNAAAPSAAAELTDGEVRKVDVETGKLTLKHGEIKSLDMPAMTMVFVVKDKALLDKLKAGDRIRFRAVNDGGRFTVTEIAPPPR